ncbi:hypothetical protein [Sorangium sp. So ce385]|uniref:hypothetical protein n=1 Tax=Sorangium sp. So ce385 TaxID=3133308 RepID=UPI003F5C55D7
MSSGRAPRTPPPRAAAAKFPERIAAVIGKVIGKAEAPIRYESFGPEADEIIPLGRRRART